MLIHHFVGKLAQIDKAITQKSVLPNQRVERLVLLIPCLPQSAGKVFTIF
jgi:hypothetical protein